MSVKGHIIGLEDDGNNVKITFNRDGDIDHLSPNTLNIPTDNPGLAGAFDNVRIGGDNPSEIELVLDDPNHDRPRVTGVKIDGQGFDLG